jgi:hypothetical protein
MLLLSAVLASREVLHMNYLKQHQDNASLTHDESMGWFTHLPEYQEWIIYDGPNMVCYVTPSDSDKTSLLSRLICHGTQPGPTLDNTIYVNVANTKISKTGKPKSLSFNLYSIRP